MIDWKYIGECCVRLVQQEAEWCKGNPQFSGKIGSYGDGFIDGLKQAEALLCEYLKALKQAHSESGLQEVARMLTQEKGAVQ